MPSLFDKPEPEKKSAPDDATLAQNIWNLIRFRVGKKSAVSASFICDALDIKDRAIRTVIENLRLENGKRIVACSRGYFLAHTKDELMEYCRQLKSHAVSELVIVSALLRMHLKDTMGQLQLEYEDYKLPFEDYDELEKNYVVSVVFTDGVRCGHVYAEFEEEAREKANSIWKNMSVDERNTRMIGIWRRDTNGEYFNDGNLIAMTGGSVCQSA